MHVHGLMTLPVIKGPSFSLPGLRSSQIPHDSIRIGSHKEQLLSKNANIVIQKRPLSPDTQHCLQSLHRLPPFRQQVSLVVLDKEVEEEIGILTNVLEHSEIQQWLSQDIQALAQDFCSVLGHGRITATLALIDRTLCPRWHADHVTMRLLCTYIGAGTEFVENRFADRRPLRRLLFQDTQGYGIRDEDAVQRATPGDALYLKGHAFPGNTGCGAVHRSPAASAAAPRLVLTLDEAAPLHTRECNCGGQH